MSYLAIARKYRPATFDEIVGQDHVTRTLRNAIERDRIHHAFLFTGARGVGKTTAARALARALNCEQGPTPEPCGDCRSCREITAGMSPDLIEIDGASNNSVNDIRELRETVRYAPTHGRRKIYLIDEVHMLSKGAFNALLKTLEEPPEHVVFIFATTEPNQIPDTILSRVQRFDFKRIPVPAVVERLRDIAGHEGASLSDDALRIIARAGEGSMRDAQSLLDQVISFAGPEISDDEVVQTLGLIDRSLLYDTLEGLIDGDPARCLDAIERVYTYGYELSQFTSELLEVLRNATFVRLSDQSRKHVDLADDELARLDELTEGVDPEVLSRTFAALLDVHDQVSRASRPRIVLEMAVARLATIRPVEPVAKLLGRLERLEQRLRRKGSPAPTSGYRSRGASRKAAPPTTHTPPPRSRPSKPAPSRSEPSQAEPPRGTASPSDAESPAPPSPTAPWAALCEAIGDLPGARVLVEGTPEHIGDTLTVYVRSVRAQAQARSLVGRPEVQQAVAASYGPDTTLQVEARAQSGDEADPAEALRRDALRNPKVRRIVETLGADIQAVEPLNDGDTP